MKNVFVMSNSYEKKLCMMACDLLALGSFLYECRLQFYFLWSSLQINSFALKCVPFYWIIYRQQSLYLTWAKYVDVKTRVLLRNTSLMWITLFLRRSYKLVLHISIYNYGACFLWTYQIGFFLNEYGYDKICTN